MAGDLCGADGVSLSFFIFTNREDSGEHGVVEINNYAQLEGGHYGRSLYRVGGFLITKYPKNMVFRGAR